jgi:hypothetical protein
MTSAGSNTQQYQQLCIALHYYTFMKCLCIGSTVRALDVLLYTWLVYTASRCSQRLLVGTVLYVEYICAWLKVAWHSYEHT